MQLSSVQPRAGVTLWQINEFMDKDSIINEFALVYKLRNAFPLHYAVFKQVSSHLCHEANTEQLFSLAGGFLLRNLYNHVYSASKIKIYCCLTRFGQDYSSDGQSC